MANGSVVQRGRASGVLLAAGLALAACGGGGGGGDDGGGGGGGGGPTAAASDCLNPALYVVGTTFRFDAQVSGYAAGRANIVGSVARLTSFEGQTDVHELDFETDTRVTVPGAGLIEDVTRTLDYGRRTGNSVTQYGKIETSISDPATGSARTVYAPPRADGRFGLAVGQSLTITTTATRTVTLPSGAQPPVSEASTDTVTYVGQETITVPAGSFTACRFDVVNDPEGPTTEWLGVGNGAPLRTIAGPGSSTELRFELQGSSRINGAPL